MTAPRYEIHRSRLRRRWFVRSVGANGETLAHSEQLNSRQAAEENIDAQRRLHTAPVEDKT
jgi:uncharacterized protein YegP (UPF0339 family)